MPQVTIYVPRDLYDLVRAHHVKISRTCQVALRARVRAIEKIGGPNADDALIERVQRTAIDGRMR